VTNAGQGTDSIDNSSSASGRPCITVIVFSRNAAATIDRTLRSVVDQDVPGLELIVLDGGSTDGTVEIIRKYDRNIRFWRSAPDGGSTNAIIEGVDRATGDVVSLLPADDWLEPGALKSVVEQFAADPALEVLSCGTRYVRVDPDGRLHVDAQFLSTDVLQFTLPYVLRHPLTCARFIKRSVYRRLGGHNAGYRLADFEFLVRVCVAGVNSRVLPRLTYTYRRHAGSDTLSAKPEMVYAMMRESIRIASDHLGNPALSETDRRALIKTHGWASARYALMQLKRRDARSALSVVLRALRINGAWPFQLPGWILKRLLERARGG
jgi:glycosyltransferase involved in cell wall biosynthesis